MNPTPQASTANAPAIGSRVAGRYLIEAELGRGGMARVYRVCDDRSGERLALKQLCADGEQAGTVQAMFEREYHTLVQLAHPRIVRAFEYGVDRDGPYYTMELLDGADVRETFRHRTPSVRESAVVLRDIASALALVHSRRMVHRDVGPRNVWCLPDGRAKLIDFGTLVAMGPQSRVAGTAPLMPPEALHMQPLDARCDIYALGALAYYLLTGRHAYPAREMSELRHVWQRGPTRPDALVPEVPRALADLVMAMLSLDARGRPGSAAEVVERLGAICELPAGDERHDAQAFLTSPKLVGREDESGALRKRLLRAVRGRGSAVSVVAPAGLGRSRMLASLVVEAKLLGAAAISVDASAVGSGQFAVAGAIVARLLEVVPLAAAGAVEAAPVLGHLSPAVHRALGEPALAQLRPLERRLRLSAAILTLVDAAARAQRVVIAVDDVQRCDGASLGVLGKLSLLAPERRLLLLTSCDAAVLEQPPPALDQLCHRKQRVTLGPLTAEHTRELLASLFGEISHLSEAASYMHELSQGSPQSCMQYAQYLVDHGIARYEGGQFKLPRNLRAAALPPTLGAMLEARLTALGDDARALALGLALARDETRAAWQPAMHVRIEDFPKLIDGDAACAFRALDELLHAGLLEQRDSYYVLCQRAMTDALLRITPEHALRRAHALVAGVLLQEGYRAGFMAIAHLQRAGEHERARERIVLGSEAYKAGGGAFDWGAMRLSVSTECTIAALAHYHAHGGSPREGLMLRRLLLLSCSVYDWSNVGVAGDQIAQARADCGLVHWDETDSLLPPLARVVQCMQRAQQAYEQKPECERGFAPLEAVAELVSSSVSLASAALHMHDVARARSVPDIIAPLRVLSPAADRFGLLAELACARVRGLEIGDRTLQAAYQLGEDQSIPDIIRIGASVVQLHVHVVDDARHGRQRALELMDLLASISGNDLFYVVHGRWLAYGFRGQAKLAEHCRRQIEVITEDDVWRRKAFLFAEAQLHALTGDLRGLQRTSEAIAELAGKFPGWRAWLAFCAGEIHRLRGDLDAALAELDAALAFAPPGEHRAYVLAAPARAELLLARGDADGALREACALAEQVAARALERSAEVAAERVRALAHARRAEHGPARAAIVRAFELAHELGYDGLPLGRLYEAQAAIALAAGERSACAQALSSLWRLLEHADAPALFRAYEVLREASARSFAGMEAPAAPPPLHAALAESDELATQVRTRMSALDDRHERARHGLQLLLEDSGAGAGHLFLFDAGGPFAAASLGGRSSSEGLVVAVEQYLQAELQETKTAVVTASDLSIAETSTPGVLLDGDTSLTPILLCDTGTGRSALVGLALLAAGGAPLCAVRPELARAISRCLLATGDSLPMIPDEP